MGWTDWLALAVAAVAGGLLAWTYAGYPVWLQWRCRRIDRDAGPAAVPASSDGTAANSESTANAPASAAPELPFPSSDPPPPTTVTAILAAHDAEPMIGARLANLLLESDLAPGSDLPGGIVLDVVLVTDGCTDDTAGAADTWAVANGRQRTLTIIEQPDRRGKATCLNIAVAAARGDLLLFCDARQRFDRQAIRTLVRALISQPRLSAVSGNLDVAPAGQGSHPGTEAEGGIGGGVDLYWRLERRIRHCEARLDSAIGCTGAIYLMRRSLYRPIPAGTILDDVLIPMQTTAEGWRVGFEPAARAWDPQPLLPGHEARRKRRTLAGNFQLWFRHPSWCLPWRHRLWFRWWSHKILRLWTPALLQLLLLVTALALVFHLQPPLIWQALGVAQLVFYTIAVPAVMGLRWPSRWLRLPGAFLFLQLQVVAGAAHYLRNRRRNETGAW